MVPGAGVAGAAVVAVAAALAPAPDAASVAGDVAPDAPDEAVAGAAAAAAPPPVFAPHPDDEHEAFPVGVAEVVGATSLACTGFGSLPPHAVRAPAPRTASTAAKFSSVRFGRIVVSFRFPLIPD